MSPVRPAAVLFGVAIVALVTAAVLTVVAVVPEDGPEACCAGPVAARNGWLSPPPATAATPVAPRPTGLPACLIGSWRIADEALHIEFYIGFPRTPFSTSGAYFELRADGTAASSYDNVNIIGQVRGKEARIVLNGARLTPWSATDTTLNFGPASFESLVYVYYEGGRNVGTKTGSATPDKPETYEYTCTPGGAAVIRGGVDRITSTWVRTAGVGVYG